MFILKLQDRNGKELKQGDVVKISDGKRFQFYSEVKWLEKEKAIAPFHTFSFHSIEKVDFVPEGANMSTEERYKIWWINDPENDEKAEDHNQYLMDWRQCESNIGNKCYSIEPINENQ